MELAPDPQVTSQMLRVGEEVLDRACDISGIVAGLIVLASVKDIYIAMYRVAQSEMDPEV